LYKEKQMKMWAENLKAATTRRLAVAVFAVAVMGGVAIFNFSKSAHAASTLAKPAPAAAAAALDDNSVAALLTLDRAMETLAARVTPAVVNVTVASKGHGQGQANTDEEGGGPDMEQFFGPGGPFQQFGNPFGGGQQRRQFRFQGPQNRVEHGLGSGVIISPDGYIVTNNHVIDGAVDIRVTMSNKEVMSAKLIGADPLTDLAVIKVEAKNLPSVPWGNSANLHPGQTVLAFGNPYGFQFTVTRGIISALNRPNPDASDRRKPGEFIQTDAAINPGNSGGALVNARGELIGINTFLVSGSGSFAGMGFAIPAQIVEPTVNTLIRDGKITHGFIGIQIADVTPDNAKFFHLDKAAGALVSDVTADSPGAKADLRSGDVITQLDGKPVSDAGQLQAMVAGKRPGDTIHLEVMRDDKPVSVPVTLEELGGKNGAETASSEHGGKGRWGLSLGELTPQLRDQLQASNSVHGALVNDVLPGSPADNAGIARGDIIMEVNRRSMKSASDVASALRSVEQGKDALVLVWSNGGSTFRVLHSSQDTDKN
jgi:serine protease Do